MRRWPLIVAALAALVALGALSSLVTQGFQEVAEAERERAQLEAQRAELEGHRAELQSTLDALRTDPAAVESMARRDLGWVRPGEKVLLLAAPTPVATPVLTLPEPTPILSLPD